MCEVLTIILWFTVALSVVVVVFMNKFNIISCRDFRVFISLGLFIDEKMQLKCK